MNIECPICHSELNFEQINDSEDLYLINKDGTCKYLDGREDGGSRVFCSNDESHKITEEIVNKVLDIVDNCET
jgi:hypothetical protein